MFPMLFVILSLPSSLEGQDKAYVEHAIAAPDQWPLQNFPASLGWKKWMDEIDTSGVFITMADTGTCPEHPDMPVPLISWDALAGSSVMGRNDGHGCGMASITHARGLGMLGLARRSPLLDFKVTSVAPNDVYRTIEGIQAATRQAKEILLVNPKARFIMNMSFGRVVDGPADELLNQAAQAAEDVGIILVIAAGNFGENRDLVKYTPDASGAIRVCGVDKEGRLVDKSTAMYSSAYGPKKVHICAPGLDVKMAAMVQRLAPKDGSRFEPGSYPTYLEGSGTSPAAAYVTGAIALMLGQDPGMTLDQIKTTLFSSGTPMEGGDNISASGKMLNLRFLRQPRTKVRGSRLP